MKAMTREELAYRAGVDRKTFYRYLKSHQDELRAIGMRPRERLPPAVVKWIVDAYGVTLTMNNGAFWGILSHNGA